MAVDSALGPLQTSVTKTATFSGPWLDLGQKGTPRRGMWVRVIFSAADNASGSNTVEWSIDTSPDNGTTVYAGKSQDAEGVLTLSTTAQAGEHYIPINTALEYIRLTCTIAGAGTSPTVTYQGDVVLDRP